MHCLDETFGKMVAYDVAIDVQVLRSFMEYRVGCDVLGCLIIAVQRNRKIWVDIKIP